MADIGDTGYLRRTEARSWELDDVGRNVLALDEEFGGMELPHDVYVRFMWLLDRMDVLKREQEWDDAGRL